MLLLENVNASGHVPTLVQTLLSLEEPYAQITNNAQVQMDFVSLSLVMLLMPQLIVSTLTSVKLPMDSSKVSVLSATPLATHLQLANPDTATMEPALPVQLVKSVKPLTQIVTGATQILDHATTLILHALGMTTLHAKLQTI